MHNHSDRLCRSTDTEGLVEGFPGVEEVPRREGGEIVSTVEWRLVGVGSESWNSILNKIARSICQ